MDKQNHAETMEDKYYMTYILFYGLGILSLVPSHFFTTATDYWMYKFRDPNNVNYTSQNRTGLQAQFASDYSIVAHVSSIAFLIITIVLLKNIPVLRRMIGALFGIIILFILTIIFVEINTDSWQIGFFILTLVTGFCLTAFGSIFMATLFQVVPNFPAKYLPVILSGQSICGILSALVQIMSLSTGASSKTKGFVYFFIGLIFVSLISAYFFITLRKSEFFKYYISKETKVEKVDITRKSVLHVLNKMKYYIISMIAVSGSSSMIHPGVTSLVISVNKGNGNPWNDLYFVPVTTFFLYNLFEYIGRECATAIKRPKNGIIILVLSLCRVSLVPMLMLCNAHPRRHLPVIFDADVAYIIFIIIFAFTNGFLVNLCIIQVPIVTTPQEMKLAVVFIFVIMVTSLGLCSFISAALVKSL